MSVAFMQRTHEERKEREMRQTSNGRSEFNIPVKKVAFLPATN